VRHGVRGVRETKSASMPGEFGQVSSYVKRITTVLPSGDVL